MSSEPELRLFAGGKVVQRVPLVGSLLQENAGGSRAMWFMCLKAKQCASGSTCSQIDSVGSIEPVVQLNSRPGLTERGYASLRDGTLEKADSCDSRALAAPSACDENAVACVLDPASF